MKLNFLTVQALPCITIFFFTLTLLRGEQEVFLRIGKEEHKYVLPGVLSLKESNHNAQERLEEFGLLIGDLEESFQTLNTEMILSLADKESQSFFKDIFEDANKLKRWEAIAKAHESGIDLIATYEEPAKDYTILIYKIKSPPENFGGIYYLGAKKEEDWKVHQFHLVSPEEILCFLDDWQNNIDAKLIIKNSKKVKLATKNIKDGYFWWHFCCSSDSCNGGFSRQKKIVF